MSAPVSPSASSRFSGPAAWRGDDLARDSAWIHAFTPGERAEIVALGRSLESASSEAVVAKQRVDLSESPQLRERLAAIRETLKSGRGFLLLRGFPQDVLSPSATRLAYLALGTALGVPKPQNRHGELLHDVRDVGADRHDPNTRLSTTNAEQDFHTDAADIIGLLCLKKSKSGGLSRIVSSVTVFNEVAKARPDLVPLLFQPWYFHLKGEQPKGAPPYFPMPIAHVIGGQLATFYIGWYIRDAEKLPGVPPLTAGQRELLALFERTANDPALYLDMAFEPGDIQLLKNSVILHKRTEYEDHAELECRRHLLRLWLAAQDFSDGIAVTREGHSASVTETARA